MARTITGSLLSAQQASNRTPYIRVVIKGVDYSSRVLFVEHHEEPYRDWASIRLLNDDRLLDSVDLLGYRFRVGYGYTTELDNEYSETADLWVKEQTLVSSPGELACELYCEGQWMYLREQHLMAGAADFAILDPADVGDDPYFEAVFNGTKTIYELIESVLESAFGWTLAAAPSPDDNVLTAFKPVYSLENLPYAATVLMDLIQMTGCYLRAKANLNWEIVYPQNTDAANETYYSNQEPVFLEYAERKSLLIPNAITVFAGNPDDLTPWPTPVIVGEATYDDNYDEVMEPEYAPSITNATDAYNRAVAVLTRKRAEQLAAYLIIYHDARVELYDKVVVEDWRGV